MNDLDLLSIAIFTLTGTMGSGVIAYAGYANLKGLPAGAIFAKDFSFLQGLAWLALIGSIVAAWYFGAWWHALAVLLVANILTRLLFAAFAPQVQILLTLGTPIMLGVSIWWIWRI